MTVICSFQVQGFPVLFGDLLISTEIENPHLRLPLTDTRGINYQNDGRVAGLRQKIVVINDQLAVAWTGYVDEAQTAIKDLRKHLEENGETSSGAISYFIDNHDLTKRGAVSFTGILRELDGRLKIMISGYGICRVQNPFGNIFLAGSGANHVNEIFRAGVLESTTLTGDLNDISAIACGYALQIATILALDEWSAKSTLAACFGGGYEVVTYWEGKMRKEEETTFLIFHSTLNHPHSSDQVGPHLWGPHVIVKQKYFGKDLYIRAVEWEKVEEKYVISFDKIFGPIQSIDVNEITTEINPPTKLDMPLNSTMMCCGLLAESASGEVFYAAIVEQNFGDDWESSMQVSYDEHGNLYSFDLSGKMLARLKANALKAAEMQ